jgi:hypothetical protein
MRSLVEQMSSPAWWIGVVLVGIIINLVSAYCKGPIDRILGALSTRWATRTAVLQRESADRITLMTVSAEARTMARFEILISRVWAVMFFQVATFFGVLHALGFFRQRMGMWAAGFFIAATVLGALNALMLGSARFDELVASSRKGQTAA